MSYRLFMKSGMPYEFPERIRMSILGERYVFQEEDGTVVEILEVADVVGVNEIGVDRRDMPPRA